MALFTIPELVQLAKSVGVPDPELAAAVAMAETGLRYRDGVYRADSNVEGDVNITNATWDTSVGLWQIRSLKAEAGTGKPRDRHRLKDPTFNAEAMRTISKSGTDFTPWSTYKTGKHEQHYTKGPQMAWSLAPALAGLRQEINAAFGDRSKVSDGSIGDRKHSSRYSDHNPNRAGVVCAIDITRDDRFIFRLLDIAIRDHRVNYVIFDGYIYSRGYGFRKRVYTGRNKHRFHLHISILQSADKYNDGRPWGFHAAVVTPAPAAVPQTSEQRHPTLPAYSGFVGRYGGYNAKEFMGKYDGFVHAAQDALNRTNLVPKLKPDGYFGPVTEAAVKGFQGAVGFAPSQRDGILGPQTWAALKAN